MKLSAPTHVIALGLWFSRLHENHPDLLIENKMKQLADKGGLLFNFGEAKDGESQFYNPNNVQEVRDLYTRLYQTVEAAHPDVQYIVLRGSEYLSFRQPAEMRDTILQVDTLVETIPTKRVVEIRWPHTYNGRPWSKLFSDWLTVAIKGESFE